jgi:hypothetical protein
MRGCKQKLEQVPTLSLKTNVPTLIFGFNTSRFSLSGANLESRIPTPLGDLQEPAWTRTFCLEDAGSRNGTFVGSDRLTGRVGRTWLRVDPPCAALEETSLDEE